MNYDLHNHRPANQPVPTWRLASVMTRSAFLHVEDALRIGKFKLLVGNYRAGQGASAVQSAYVDIDAFRIVLYDLHTRQGLLDILYGEQREVTFYGGSTVDGQLISRIITLRDDPSKDNPIMLQVASGPGKRTQTNGIAPAPRGPAGGVSGEMQRAAIFLARWETRKLAGRVLAELAAWEQRTQTARIRAYIHEQEMAAPVSAATKEKLNEALRQYAGDEQKRNKHVAASLKALRKPSIGSINEGQARTWIAWLWEQVQAAIAAAQGEAEADADDEAADEAEEQIDEENNNAAEPTY